MTQTHIKQFKALYKKRTGILLDDETARVYAEMVLGYVREVVKDSKKQI